MRVAVLGAGGIVGQHMVLSVPENVTPLFVRKNSIPQMYVGVDLENVDDTIDLLARFEPDVIVNLAGENRVDVVQNDPATYEYINAKFPALLASWCERAGAYLIQVSTQGVFSGENAPYSPDDQPNPLTKYGEHKSEAERWVLDSGFTVARLTLVLGTRPFRGVGRENPFEHMVRSTEQSQVDDRFFSPVFAEDAARQLWSLALADKDTIRKVYHIGIPYRFSRYQIASELAWIQQAMSDNPIKVHKVSHNHFPGLAPRPKDTTWAYGSLYNVNMEDGIIDSYSRYKGREVMDLKTRATEISQFLSIPYSQVESRLAEGFHFNHALVAKDFKDANTDVSDADSLLRWYRETTAYIFELSAYHLEEGFNYSGMCRGLADHLVVREKKRPLALGDGIGDLTMEMANRPQLNPTYHDLEGSNTAKFAQFRFLLNVADDIPVDTTDGWDPIKTKEAYDAVIALDFFEHLVNVEDWVYAVYDALVPGGLFLAQNAFGIGDVEHGDSIPMHLSVNNRFVEDWEPLLRVVGFEATGEGTWWRKPE